jgi:hypothetical protein
MMPIVSDGPAARSIFNQVGDEVTRLYLYGQMRFLQTRLRIKNRHHL